MSTQNESQNDTRSYIVLEVDVPAVIQVSTTDVFYAKAYRMTEKFIHGRGHWAGGEGKEETVTIPVTSVVYIQFESKEVTKSEVPPEHQSSVELQISSLKPPVN